LELKRSGGGAGAATDFTSQSYQLELKPVSDRVNTEFAELSIVPVGIETPLLRWCPRCSLLSIVPVGIETYF